MLSIKSYQTDGLDEKKYKYTLEMKKISYISIALNIIFILILCGFIHIRKKDLNKYLEQYKELSIKYDTALSYIDQIPEIYEIESNKFPNMTLKTMDGIRVGTIDSYQWGGKLILYVSSNHCQNCVDFIMSYIPEINKIIDKNRLIVLYYGFSDKDLYLWKKENKIDNVFLNISNSDSTPFDIEPTMPLLFTLDYDSYVKYPYAPEKLFDESLRSYLYTIQSIIEKK